MNIPMEMVCARPIGPQWTELFMDAGSRLETASAGPLRLKPPIEEKPGTSGNAIGIPFSCESTILCESVSYIFVMRVSNENCTAVRNWKADRWLGRHNSHTRQCKSAWWTHAPKTLINVCTDYEIFRIEPK